MATLTHDAPALAPTRRIPSGMAFALLASLSFGMSGTLARGLMSNGWSSGAIVTVRVAIAAIVLLPLVLRAVDGRWHLVKSEWRLIVNYGVLAVATAQLCYFTAVETMPVAVALLIEYMAPLVVIAYLAVLGQRPNQLMLLGAALALVGLAMVLGVGREHSLSLVGIIWALGAMLGCAAYFILSAQPTHLPPLVLAGLGLAVAAVVLATATAIGVLPWHSNTVPVTYGALSVSWWQPLVFLGVVTAALAYVAGIEAGQRLGPRLASFVSLTEVLAALCFAWIILAEAPTSAQLWGGALVLAGVIAVKYAEPHTG